MVVESAPRARELRLKANLEYYGWPLDGEDQRTVRCWFRRKVGAFAIIRRFEEQFSLSLRKIPNSALICLGSGSRIPSGYLTEWKGSVAVYEHPEDILYESPARYFAVWSEGGETMVLQMGHLQEGGPLLGVYSCCPMPSKQWMREIGVIPHWPGTRDQPQPQFRFRVVRVAGGEVAWQISNLEIDSSQERYRDPRGEEGERLRLAVLENLVQITGSLPLSEGSEFQLTIPLYFLPKIKD